MSRGLSATQQQWRLLNDVSRARAGDIGALPPMVSSTRRNKRNKMSNRLFATLGLLLLMTVFAAAQTGRTIQVDVTYTGSGTVDASHKIFIALWDSADLNAGPPVAVKPLDSKIGTVTFSDVAKVPAYVSAAYDPTGKWEAQSPPPSGSS